MPAKHHIDNKAKLIVTEWEGEAVGAELIEAIQKYQQEIQCQPDYMFYNEVLDFSNISGIKLSTREIIRIARIASTTDRKNYKKLALIVSSTLAFGLARMYISYRSFEKNSNKEIRVFRNKNDAFEWVKN
ncbi:MAG: STAS/SEC14 domain-containing protein [Gammaproteobacteria bacterium]|nr:STAS/SEC14 domain-containing protein [Gammaproteobacteria bacterium]